MEIVGYHLLQTDTGLYYDPYLDGFVIRSHAHLYDHFDAKRDADRLGKVGVRLEIYPWRGDLDRLSTARDAGIYRR